MRSNLSGPVRISRPRRAWATVRASAARGFARLQATGWAIGQCGVAAIIAWLIAREGLGHPRPFFAPTAAVVCVGWSATQRLRRVVELAAGVSIGILVGDVLTREIGSGWWQLGLVVVLATGAAQFLGGGPLVTAQAGVQAIFLVALPQPAGSGFSRWEDALVGGGTALAVAVLLPPDPTRPLRSQAQSLITELAGVVTDSAAALRAGSAERADAALERARSTQTDLERWSSALQGSVEISRISPLRRNRRAEVERYGLALVGVDRAARNMRVAIRRVAAELDSGGPLPAALPELLENLAIALRALRHEVGEPLNPDGVSAGALRALAARLDPDALDAHTLSATVIVGQLRSCVVDLLGVTGLDAGHARDVLPG